MRDRPFDGGQKLKKKGETSILVWLWAILRCKGRLMENVQGYGKWQRALLKYILLYIDLRPGQTCHSKVMHWKEVAHSDGSYEKKSRRRVWLTIWDKVKSHGTLIDWCTGREWPVNCMTVISAWWRSNMPFQRLSGRLNYYITRWDRKSVSWRSDELEPRYGRESPHSAEWASGPPGLRLSSPVERERHNTDGHKSGGQYIAVLFGLQLPLTRKSFK